MYYTCLMVSFLQFYLSPWHSNPRSKTVIGNTLFWHWTFSIGTNFITDWLPEGLILSWVHIFSPAIFVLLTVKYILNNPAYRRQRISRLIIFFPANIAKGDFSNFSLIFFLWHRRGRWEEGWPMRGLELIMSCEG